VRMRHAAAHAVGVRMSLSLHPTRDCNASACDAVLVGAVALHEAQDGEEERARVHSLHQHCQQVRAYQHQQLQQQQRSQQQQQQALREEQRERMQRGDYGSRGGAAEERVTAMQGAAGQPVGFGR
jgi:hypothetical protein